MFDNVKQMVGAEQSTENNNVDFDSVEGRIELAATAVDENGDVQDFDVLADIADAADINGHRGVEREYGGTTTRVGSILAGGLQTVATNDPEEIASELASLRAVLDEGAPDHLPSTGEKGMWKQAKTIKVQTLEWALGV